MLLATLLMPVAVIASGSVKTGAKLYFSLLLLLETAMLGVFMARDWSLFYVFWELTLIPLFFLIDRLGGQNRQRRQKAALNFVLYTMGGSVFMLIALLLLYDAVPTHSFSMSAIAEAARGLPIATQVWIFAGLFIGFGVKMAVFPMHGWAPLVYAEAPSAVPLISSGILLKMGGYGLLRAVETLPGAAWALQGWLVALAFVTLLYGGILAWRSRDLMVMLAYSSISHMGVVLLGLAALNTAGFTGAVMQMVAHGLVAGALFLLVGLLHARTRTRDIGDYSSLVRTMPRFAFFMVLALVAAVGLPGTAGFIAELHVLVGGFARWGGWMVLLSLSLLISAAYAFRTVGRLFTGPVGETMKQRARPDAFRDGRGRRALLRHPRHRPAPGAGADPGRRLGGAAGAVLRRLRWRTTLLHPTASPISAAVCTTASTTSSTCCRARPRSRTSSTTTPCTASSICPSWKRLPPPAGSAARPSGCRRASAAAFIRAAA